MATIVLGLSFQREAAQLPRNEFITTGAGLNAHLQSMTAVFRLSFGSMISSMRIFQVPEKTVHTPTATIKPISCSSYEVSTKDVHGHRTSDFLLIVVLDVHPNDPSVEPAAVWSCFRSLQSKISLLKDCGLAPIVDAYSPGAGRTVGQNSYTTVDQPLPDSKVLSSVFAFYFLGWIICLRIERIQLATELTLGREAVRSSGFEVANQRLSILNLSRYFLTEDRTNDPILKQTCVALVDKLKLRKRFERALMLHREFEHHFENTSRLLQSQQLGSVSNLLLILTLFSVPISFFGAAIAINLQGDIFQWTGSVLTNPLVYIILIVGVIAVLLPFAVLKVLDRFKGLD